MFSFYNICTHYLSSLLLFYLKILSLTFYAPDSLQFFSLRCSSFWIVTVRVLKGFLLFCRWRKFSRLNFVFDICLVKIKATRARPGFEPGTSRTQSENHTPRPPSHVKWATIFLFPSVYFLFLEIEKKYYAGLNQQTCEQNYLSEKENFVNQFGLDRDLNPGPLTPEARIIPLDHRAGIDSTLISPSPCQAISHTKSVVL